MERKTTTTTMATLDTSVANNNNDNGGDKTTTTTTSATTTTKPTTTSLTSTLLKTAITSSSIAQSKATKTSSSSSTYKLQFESHYKHLSNSLVRFLAEQHCCDCHISTGFHYPLIRTHRLILSAFSPYFQQLFDSLQSTDVPDKPMIVGGSYFPIIVIKDFSYETICHIVEFCYRGKLFVCLFVFFLFNNSII